MPFAIARIGARGGRYRRSDGPASLVPEHDDQRRVQMLSRVLDAAELEVAHNLPGGADIEEGAQRLIEHDFRRHAGIVTTHDHRDRVLRLRQLRPPSRLIAREAMARDETLV